MKLPVFLFDLDGTIIDSIDFALENDNTILRKYGLPEITRKKYLEIIDPDFKVIAKRLGLTKEKQFQEILDGWDSGIENGHSFLKIYDGIDKVIRKLSERGYKLAIITRNNRNTTLNHLKRFKLENCFQCLITCDDVKSMKPHEEQFLYAANALGVDIKDVVFVEDMYQSIITANKLGMKTIAVTWGFDRLKKLKKAKPDFIVNNIKELEDVIERHLKP
jgi:phosphoglycolate phosphatase-like HAD superfamily hydrolase